MLASLSPARRRFVLTIGAVVATAVVATGASLAIHTAIGTVDPVAQDQPGPVLLVSGYGGSTRSLNPLRDQLQAEGRDVVVVPPVGGGTGDIQTQAKALGSAAEAATKRTGAASVDVVGYSAGGVVARTWVRDFGGDGLARRVLSIGSPQHGTAVAELAVGLAGGCPTGCQQLAPDSDLLRRLNAGDETPSGPLFVSVWSTSDDVVVPPESASLEGGVNFSVQSVCPDERTPHGSLPSDPVVLATLRTALGTASPSIPTGSVCGRVSS
jgi:triacylglycerol lipase